MQEVTFTAVSTLDIIILLFLAYGGWKGFQKGFLVELVLLILFVASVLLVFRMIEGGFTYMEQDAGMGRFPKASVLFSFLLFYGVVSLGISILGKILTGLLPTVFEGADKILGAILGILKYITFCGILFMLLETSGIFDHQKIVNSTMLYGIIMDTHTLMIDVGKTLTASFMGDLVDSMERLLTNPR